MTDLEKLITAFLDIPPHTLEGLEDTIEVQWIRGARNSLFLAIELPGMDRIFFDPTQTLALLDWLKEQRENLETLQEALRAQQVEDKATKGLREAERINALKALHSETVTAWQRGGCEGPCPTYADIVRRESLVRYDLDSLDGVTLSSFVREYPMLGRLRRKQIDATPAIPLQPGVGSPIRDAIRASKVASAQQDPFIRPDLEIPIISTEEELAEAQRKGERVVFIDTQGRDLEAMERLRASVKRDGQAPFLGDMTITEQELDALEMMKGIEEEQEG